MNKLHLGAPHICILRGAHLSELGLKKEILTDILTLFPKFTHQALAEDVFNGAFTREAITKILNGGWSTPYFPPLRTYAMVAAILMRNPIQMDRTYGLRSLRDGPVSMPREMRQGLLCLLYHYGVSCAASECCDAALDPISKPWPLNLEKAA